MGNLEESTEIAILGAGPGGYVAAIRLAQLGKEVTVISIDETPGGACLLRGCIPSKSLITATQTLDKIKHAGTMGIEVNGASINIAKLQAWKQSTLDRLSKGIFQLFKQHGIRFIHGKASFKNAHCLEIQTETSNQTLNFEHAIIATGSRPRPIPNFIFDGSNIISSKEALCLTKIPENFLVIGGGYIGLELSGVYANLGSKITIVEATDQLLPGLDRDLLRAVKRKLKDKGVSVLLNTLAIRQQQNKTKVEVSLKNAAGEESQTSYDKVLVAVGRIPNSENIGLKNAAVTTDGHGFIAIDKRCKTNQNNIYAIGDVAGGMMLAHKASREGKIAAAQIAGQTDAMDNQVPAVIFTDPEIAYVGLQENTAIEMGLEVNTGMFPFAALGRAQTMNETEGFVKVVSEKSSGRVLGVQMVGPHVSDLIAEATLGIEMGATLEDFALTIHAHPTLPEALEEATEAAMGISIHRYQRKKR